MPITALKEPGLAPGFFFGLRLSGGPRARRATLCWYGGILHIAVRLLYAALRFFSIVAFNSVTDGLDPNRRNREHFVSNTNLDDDGPWVPYADGVWFQPCCFNVTSGGFSVVLKGLPGAQLGVHYHVGIVRGYTMRGHWRYLEHDWVAKPGTFIYEPAGEAHTLVITDDSPGPALILFIVEGGLIYLDVGQLDLLIR